MLTRTEQLLNAIAGNGDPPTYPNWAVTSDETYLYAILNESTDVPKPLTDKQKYLHYRATGTGELPDYPLTEELTYWAYFAGQTVELPPVRMELWNYIKAAAVTPVLTMGSNEYVCPTCGKTYTSSYWYEKHILTHEEDENGQD